MSLIRKPAETQRESSVRRAAEATIATGRAVRDAGKEIGDHTRRGVGKIAQYYLLGIFTFGALMADSVGAKLLGLAIMAPFWYIVLRKRKVPHSHAAARWTPGPSTSPAFAISSTQSFHYRPGKNAAGAVLLGLLAVVTAKRGLQPGDHFFLFVTVVMAVGAVVCAMHAFKSGPALAFDRDTLRIRTTFGGLQEVPWSEVHRIDLRVLSLRYMGLIPVSRNEILTVTCDGGLFGTRRLRITPSALELPPGGAATLLATLRQAQVDAVGEAGVAMAGAGPTGWGISSSAAETNESKFDADAAIARYLASKETARPQPAELNFTPDPVPQLRPQRPLFGKRTV